MSGIRVFSGFSHVLFEVAAALLPFILVFLFLQVWLLKFTKQKVINIMKGLVIVFFGLALFLQGVYVGFLPAGEAIGIALGGLHCRWVLMPIGFVLGFAAVFAEPAVRVLNYEVEKASGGYIPQQVMLYTLSLGGAVAIALAMGRILFGFPLWYVIIPGYVIAFIMTCYTTPSFVAIAFDSGGVATGPMTVTFLSAVTLGAASAIEGRNPLVEGFGMVAIAALSPILSVLLLGLLYSRKGERNGRKSTGI